MFTCLYSGLLTIGITLYLLGLLLDTLIEYTPLKYLISRAIMLVGLITCTVGFALNTPLFALITTILIFAFLGTNYFTTISAYKELKAGG